MFCARRASKTFPNLPFIGHFSGCLKIFPNPLFIRRFELRLEQEKRPNVLCAPRFKDFPKSPVYRAFFRVLKDFSKSPVYKAF